MNVWLTLFFLGSMLGLIPAYVASKKGRDFKKWWFFGTLLFVWAMPKALMIKPDRKALEIRALDDGENRKCPACAEIIKAEAKICRFCGSEQPGPEDPGLSLVASDITRRRS